MTKSQAETLAYLRAFINQRGYSPTFQQVADGLRVHFSTARYSLQRLIDDGYVTHQPRRHASFELTEKAANNGQKAAA